MSYVSPDSVIQDLIKLASIRAGAAPSSEDQAQTESDGLIGLFQAFRPDGIPVECIAKDYPGGREFVSRFQQVCEVVSNFERSDAMKDAYFIVRVPPYLDGSASESLARRFSAALAFTCKDLGIETELFQQTLDVRLLEGKPPKLPKSKDERSRLMKVLQSGLPDRIDGLFQCDTLGNKLSEALYFIACDAMLRDYLRHPLMAGDASSVIAGELLDAYFQLWRHGIKIRAFSDHQLDFYSPHRSDGSLIDAGQFARGK